MCTVRMRIRAYIPIKNNLHFLTAFTAVNPQFVIVRQHFNTNLKLKRNVMLLFLSKQQIPRGATTKCHVVVAITQQYGPSFENQVTHANQFNKDQKSSNSSFHAIGFAVYEARPNMNRITTQFVMENVSAKKIHSNCRYFSLK